MKLDIYKSFEEYGMSKKAISNRELIVGSKDTHCKNKDFMRGMLYQLQFNVSKKESYFSGL